ncbi:MAG: 2-oxoacid:acceptor oxidoreductase family protein [Acidobacteria bacterium]|nr:2-oxoacid:acceptor oxidoreductase family protein [Acidobacteriota bacterium]
MIGLTGTELLVKGALEGGVALLTGYPGSPISGVFDTLQAIAPYLDELGVVAQIANNEALAAARLSGACQAGLRAVAVMKSVGMHVAADALATGNLVEFRRPEGGGVVIVGDDPWNESTQINSDSRYLSMHLNMAVVEPATLQEQKDWVGAALDLSGAADLLITVIVTMNQADGGGTVLVRPNVRPPLGANRRGHFASEAVATGDVIMVPPFITMREASLVARQRRLHERARGLRLDRASGPDGPAPVGFITCGLSSTYLGRVLDIAGIAGRVPVLKLGLTHPVDPEPVVRLAANVQRLIVVEEKRGFVEAQVRQVLADAVGDGRLSAAPEIWGKRFGGRPGFPSVGGMNPSVVLEVLGPELLEWASWLPALDGARILRQLEIGHQTGAAAAPIPRRTPTFCPGCPHRDSAVAALSVKRRLKALPAAPGNAPLDVVVHGESGCHTMLGFPPFGELMQNYVGMGLGGGAGAGMAPFVDNRHVVFLGDSTFFHSGIVAISDSIKHGQDITYVVLDNKTTAMTGHQPTAENTADLMGHAAEPQDIERILRGMAPKDLTVVRLDPSRRGEYEHLLERTLRSPGVKVIIADKECAITHQRRLNEEKKRRLAQQGFLERVERIHVDREVCDFCLECVRQTACPGLAISDTPLGPKVATDLSLCVDDGACFRTRACPSFARVTIRRKRAPATSPASVAEPALPAPPRHAPEIWSAYLGGVGGMGIGVLTGIIARAGEFDGYHAHFVNRNGLAIRNGGVYGHVVLSKVGPPDAPFGFYGDADLLLGVDLLEACRGVHPAGNLRVAHPSRTRAVVDIARHQTVLSQSGQDQLDVDALAEFVRSRTRGEEGVFEDFSRVAEAELGSRVYANVMLLGLAFQKGWTPFTEQSLVRAIADNVRASDRAANLRALQLGRAMALADARPAGAPATRDLAAVIEERAALIAREARGGARRAAAYRSLASAADAQLRLAPADREYLAHALSDLVRYGGLALAARFLEAVHRVRSADDAERGLRATAAALRTFFQLMTPKDEFWVARLLTSPDKRERDHRRYGIDPGRGDSLSYAFLLRPRLRLFGRTFETGVRAKPWMLKLVAAGSFLRTRLPGWNREDREFLAWFTSVVDEELGRPAGPDYETLVAILEAGAQVRGFRAVRWRSMDAARAAIETRRRKDRATADVEYRGQMVQLSP